VALLSEPVEAQSVDYVDLLVPGLLAMAIAQSAAFGVQLPVPEPFHRLPWCTPPQPNRDGPVGDRVGIELLCRRCRCP